MIGKVPRSILMRLSWTTGSFGLIQLLRLLNNVILARLLSPPLFGLMLIVNAIRTGAELLSDVGINQNIVSSRKGDSPDFYDTAWTIRLVRGLLLGAFLFVSANAFATFFGEPQLAIVLPVIAVSFLLSGLSSTNSALLHKQGKVARDSSFEVVIAAVSLAAHVAFALITPTIWALVMGNIVTSAAALVASYLLIPQTRHRFMIDRDCAREMIVFGKWIFLSSVIYFFAVNFDRLYFAKQIGLAELGIYGIARSLSEMFSNLAIRSSTHVLFPAVAAMQMSGAEVRKKVLHGRRTMLLLVAVGLGGLVSIADLLILILYDPRYEAGAIMLPLLLLGVWFAVLNTVNESILLGTSLPAYPAVSNGAKLASYLVGVPLAFHHFGLFAAILVLAAGEVVRYVVQWSLSRKQHLGFGRDDLGLTVVLVIAVIGFRKLFWALGVTGDFDALFPLLEPEFWSR